MFNRLIEDLIEFGELFYSLKNPVYYILILGLIIGLFIYLVYYKIIKPLNKKYLEEKRLLVIKHERLLSLFAELDPDPLLAVDLDGKIIRANKSAESLNVEKNIMESKLDEIILSNKLNIQNILNNNEIKEFELTINNKIFSVTLKPVVPLKIAHVYFHNITARKNAEKQMKSYQEKLRELTSRMEESIDDEKRKISQELHDGIGQQLSVLKLDIQNNHSNGITLIETIDKVNHELRQICRGLRPPVLLNASIETALITLVNEAERISGIIGQIEFLGEYLVLRKNTEMNLFRIAQEAINNIVKHSGAKLFKVQITNQNGITSMLITDDGCGFNEEDYDQDDLTLHGLGLFSMRERAKRVSGNIIINSEEGFGTSIFLEIREG